MKYSIPKYEYKKGGRAKKSRSLFANPIGRPKGSTDSMNKIKDKINFTGIESLTFDEASAYIKANPDLRINQGIDPKFTRPLYQTSGEVRNNKVLINGKVYDIRSNEYRDLYNKNSIASVDREGVPNIYSSQQAEVVGEAPQWLKDKREKEKNPTAFYNRKAWEDLKNTVGEFSGFNSGVRIAKDPISHLKSTGNVIYNLGKNAHLGVLGPVNAFAQTNPEDLSRVSDVVNIAGMVAPYAKPIAKATSTAGKYIPKVLDKLTESKLPKQYQNASQSGFTPKFLKFDFDLGNISPLDEGTKNFKAPLFEVNTNISDEIKNLHSYLNRKKHLNVLKEKGLVDPEFPIDEYVKTIEGTDDITKRALEHAMTKYRSVSPKMEGTFHREDLIPEAKEYFLKNHSLDINNPQHHDKIAEIMATYPPFKDFGYRSGIGKLPEGYKVINAADTPDPGFSYGTHQYEIYQEPKGNSYKEMMDYYNKQNEFYNHPNNYDYEILDKFKDFGVRIPGSAGYIGKIDKPLFKIRRKLEPIHKVKPPKFDHFNEGDDLDEYYKIHDKKVEEYKKLIDENRKSFGERKLPFEQGGRVKAQTNAQLRPIIDNKRYDIRSQTYRDLYNTGNIYPVDREGVITSYAPEVEVIGKAPAWLRQQREREKDPVAFAVREGRSSIAQPLLEFTGIPSVARVAKDPMGHLQSLGRVMDEVATLGTMPSGTYSTPEDLAKTLDVVGAAGTIMPIAKPFAKGLNQAAKTTSKYLKNAYKFNPYASKEAQEIMLVRARPIGQNPYFNMAEQLRAKKAAGEELQWWQKNLLNPQYDPSIIAREKYYGQWFADNPSELDFYINPGTRNFPDDAQIEILKARMPKSEAAQYSIKNFDDAKILSNLHDNEYILPKDMVQLLKRYPLEDLGKLQAEYKKMNTPHWLTGYGLKFKPLLPKKAEGGRIKYQTNGVIKGPVYEQEIKNTYQPFKKPIKPFLLNPFNLNYPGLYISPNKILMKKSDSNYKNSDSLLENVVEFIDPTGITSHDDAAKSYDEWRSSGNLLPSVSQGLDMFGAVPTLGKLGKLRYIANLNDLQNKTDRFNLHKPIYKYFPWQKVLNTIDSVEDIDKDNLNQKKTKYQTSGGFSWSPSSDYKPSGVQSTVSSSTSPVNYEKENETSPVNKAFESESRNTLLDIYNSPGYKRKLMNEAKQSYYFPESTYNSILDARKERVSNTPIYWRSANENKDLREAKSKGRIVGGFSDNLIDKYITMNNDYYSTFNQISDENIFDPIIKENIIKDINNKDYNFGSNKLMLRFDPDKNKVKYYGENPFYALIEELEHSAHHPNYSLNYFNNITPYAHKILKENNISDWDYLQRPTEGMAKKRAAEIYLMKNNMLKPGEDVNDSHFEHLMNNYKNLPPNVRQLIDITTNKKTDEATKKAAKERFKNIMNKIAVNDNQQQPFYGKYGGRYKAQTSKNINRFNTRLNPTEFESYNKHSQMFPVLLNDKMDYDTQGLYKELYNKYNGDFDAIAKSLTPSSDTEHIGFDTYKKPNHPTFSRESKYYIPLLRNAGTWEDGYFNAVNRNIRNMNKNYGSPMQYMQYAEDYDQNGIPDIGLKHKGKVLIQPETKEKGGMIFNKPGIVRYKEGGNHGGLDRWFAEKWVDVKTGKPCGRQEGESRRSYPACRPSVRVNNKTPKTSSELSSSEKEKFKRSKTSSQRINYQHKRNK